MSDLPPVEFVSLSDVGRVRERNEDFFGEFLGPDGDRFLLVCDGMGGHLGGATASREAVAEIGRTFCEGGEVPEVLLRQAFSRANEHLHRLSASDPELSGMGTTGVGLWIGADGRGFVAHVGDSRAYRVRGGWIEQLTEDHSVVGEWVRRGLLSKEEAVGHPRKNEILRCLGVHDHVEADVNPVVLHPGDRFVLCSDGLTDVVRDEEILAATAHGPPLEVARRLVDLALQRGAPDNVTVQVVAIGGEPEGAQEGVPGFVDPEADTAGFEVAAVAPADPPSSAGEVPVRRNDLGRRLLPLAVAGLAGVLIAAVIALRVVRNGGEPPVSTPAQQQPPVAAPPTHPAPVWIPIADVSQE